MKFEEKQSMELTKSTGPVYVNFDTKGEAEDAWLEMLRNVGVEPNWTWEQCIRKASGNPIYRALKTTAERKEAFERYCRETKEERLELKQKRIEDDERMLADLFRSTPEMTGSTRFRTAEKMFKDNVVWTSALPQNRRNFFSSYVDKLKETEKVHILYPEHGPRNSQIQPGKN
jgi:pre-mRNA-processing factor 40